MTKGTNTFISWSGERSLHVAKILRTWLPKVIQSAKLWMSDSDIEKGARGLEELAHSLEDKNVGIVCLTPENLEAPWLLFEAGALSKTINDRTRLCTYLIGDLKPEDVKPPLGMFQHTRANREDTRKLVGAVNKAVSPDPLPETDLDELFDAMWPRLEQGLRSLPAAPESVSANRPQEDMIAEILELVRAAPRRDDLLEQMFMTILGELGEVHDRVTRPRSAAAAEILGSAGPSGRSLSSLFRPGSLPPGPPPDLAKKYNKP